MKLRQLQGEDPEGEEAARQAHLEEAEQDAKAGAGGWRLEMELEAEAGN